MKKKFIYADEAGDFTFNRNNHISKYFIIGTVIMDDWRPAATMMQELRHEMVHDGIDVGDYFHATTDSQQIRDKVFQALSEIDFTVQMTICEKSKAQRQVTNSKARFYKIPWYFHCKHGIAQQISGSDEIIVTAASIGTKREKKTFTTALNDVVSQNFEQAKWALDFRPCQSDPCLQIADYCTWAIQRKWERNDTRTYDLIRERVTREYDLWEKGSNHYY